MTDPRAFDSQPPDPKSFEPRTSESVGRTEPDRSPPPSPCVAICLLDPRTRLCSGCRRTPEEIGEWPTASRERKLQILAAIDER